MPDKLQRFFKSQNTSVNSNSNSKQKDTAAITPQNRMATFATLNTMAATVNVSVLEAKKGVADK